MGQSFSSDNVHQNGPASNSSIPIQDGIGTNATTSDPTSSAPGLVGSTSNITDLTTQNSFNEPIFTTTTTTTAATNTSTTTIAHYDDNNNSTGLSSNGTTTFKDDFNIQLFGTNFYPFKWFTLSNLYSLFGPLSSLAMILGCVLPYVPQYVTIHKNQNCSGFSTFVCLTLLLANILRIAFWFGHPFELPLLIQSVVMILTQILLLELCVRVKRSSIPRKFFSFKLQYFWRWTDLASYLEFIFILSLLLGIATYTLRNCEVFIESIGYCALVTESMLGFPQVIKNYKNKSVEGMSLSMVLMWLAGDAYKTIYFIVNDVPFQFWLCGSLQISIDILILIQVCLFRKNVPIKETMAL